MLLAAELSAVVLGEYIKVIPCSLPSAHQKVSATNKLTNHHRSPIIALTFDTGNQSAKPRDYKFSNPITTKGTREPSNNQKNSKIKKLYEHYM